MSVGGIPQRKGMCHSCKKYKECKHASPLVCACEGWTARAGVREVRA